MHTISFHLFCLLKNHDMTKNLPCILTPMTCYELIFYKRHCELGLLTGIVFNACSNTPNINNLTKLCGF